MRAACGITPGNRKQPCRRSPVDPGAWRGRPEAVRGALCLDHDPTIPDRYKMFALGWSDVCAATPQVRITAGEKVG